MIQLQKAKRSLAKIKLAMFGVSGSGKTMSSLLMAYGLVKAAHPDWTDVQCWEKICIIDTENGSGSLYVGSQVDACRIGEYYTIPMEPPFEAEKYIEAIHAAESAGIEVIIIDSLSHAWAGTGGLLERHGKITDASYTKNGYTAWREVTPLHNKLVDTILQSPCHVFFNMRAKTEYTSEKDEKGKTVIRNVGLDPIMRNGVEYEATICFMIMDDHTVHPTKDRTGLFDGKYFTITPETGKKIYAWLQSGASEEPKAPAPQPAKAEKPKVEPREEPEKEPTKEESEEKLLKKAREMADAAVKEYLAANPDEKKNVIAAIKEMTGGSANYLALTDRKRLGEIYKKYTRSNA